MFLYRVQNINSDLFMQRMVDKFPFFCSNEDVLLLSKFSTTKLHIISVTSLNQVHSRLIALYRLFSPLGSFIKALLCRMSGRAVFHSATTPPHPPPLPHPSPLRASLTTRLPAKFAPMMNIPIMLKLPSFDWKYVTLLSIELFLLKRSYMTIFFTLRFWYLKVNFFYSKRGMLIPLKLLRTNFYCNGHRREHTVYTITFINLITLYPIHKTLNTKLFHSLLFTPVS